MILVIVAPMLLGSACKVQTGDFFDRDGHRNSWKLDLWLEWNAAGSCPKSVFRAP